MLKLFFITMDINYGEEKCEGFSLDQGQDKLCS